MGDKAVGCGREWEGGGTEGEYLGDRCVGYGKRGGKEYLLSAPHCFKKATQLQAPFPRRVVNHSAKGI